LKPGRPVAVAVKDLRAVSRNRAAFFWIVVFPVVMLVMFKITMGGGGFHVKAAVVTHGSRIARSFVHELNGTGTVHAVVYGDERGALEALRKGRVDAVIVFPPGFDRAVAEGRHPTVRLYANGNDPRGYHAVVGALTGALNGLENGVRRAVTGRLPPDLARVIEDYAHPFGIHVKEVKGVNPGAYQTMAFLAVQALFSASLAAAMATIPEIRSGTMDRLRTTPASPVEVLLGKYLYTTVLVTSGAVLGVLVGRYCLGIGYTPSPTAWALFEAAVVSSAAVGTSVAALLRDEKAVNAVLNSIAFPSMFLGALVVPECMVPRAALRVVVNYPPVTFLHAAKLHELYGKAPSPAGLAVAAGITVALVALSGWAVSRTPR